MLRLFDRDSLVDLYNRAVDYGQNALYYGWIPMIILVGFLRSEPRPSLLRLLNPLS